MHSSVEFSPADLLRDNGFHITSQRIAILKAISDSPHCTADEIIESANSSNAKVSRQAVFDALNAFTEKGIIRRIQPASPPARYEARINDNHHHVVCRSCGDMHDVDCAVNYRPCLEANEDHGYSIDEAEVIYWGTCPNCQNEKLKV